MEEPIKSEKDPKPASEDDSEDKKKSKPVSDPLDVEVPDAKDQSENNPEDKPVNESKGEDSEKELKSVPDPSSVPVHNSSPVKRPEGENCNLVYAWRYSGDDRYAKIGETTKQLLPTRMPGTYWEILACK